MKRISILFYFFILFLIAMMTIQCASKKVQVPEEVKPIVSPDSIQYHKISIMPFTYDPSMSDHRKEIDLCKMAVYRFLTNQHLFEKVSMPVDKASPEPGALIVETKVVEIRIVSAGARVWGGAFAGKSHMTVHVRLVDPETKKVIDERDINSSTNPIAASYTFGASDSNLPDYIGEMVGYFVTEGSAKK